MKYLGIDYGLKKIGLAVSEGQIASVYKVLNINGLNDAVQKIKKIIANEKIDRLVVGVAESGESKSIVNKFIHRLKSENIQIIQTDETLSTSKAKDLMRALGVSKAKEKEDAYSAALILQNFLDQLQ